MDKKIKKKLYGVLKNATEKNRMLNIWGLYKSDGNITYEEKSKLELWEKLFKRSIVGNANEPKQRIPIFCSQEIQKNRDEITEEEVKNAFKNGN